jgi:large subunit ribosomal protein L25
VRVPLDITGRAAGVIEGGLIQVVRRDIGISCLPAEIPETVQVDVTEMNIGDSLHVADIPLSQGFTSVDSPVWTILTCAAPEAEPVVEEEVVEGEVAVGEEAEGEAGDEEKKDEEGKPKPTS